MPQLEALDVVKESLDKFKTDFSSTIEEFKTAEGSERDKLGTRLTKLEEQIEGLETVVKREASRPNLSGLEITKSGERDKFSWGRALKLITGLASKEDAEYGVEMEVFNDGLENLHLQAPEVKTAINAAGDSSGAFLIGTDVMSQIVPELEAMEVASSLGVTFINGLVENVMWVKEQGAIAAVYVNTEEEETGSESVTTFSNIEMRPHVLAAFVPLTWSMLRQPAMAMDSWVGGRISKKIALREDLSIFRGDTGQSEPRGLLNTSGIDTSVDWNGVTVGGATDTTQDLLIDMIGAIEGNDVMMNGPSMGFAMSDRVKYSLAKVKDADARRLYETLIGRNVDASLYGYNVGSSTQLRAAATTDDTIIFGDFSELVVGRWGTIAISSSDTTETNFRKLRTTIRGVMAHDVAVLQPSAFTSGQNFDNGDF